MWNGAGQPSVIKIGDGLFEMYLPAWREATDHGSGDNRRTLMLTSRCAISTCGCQNRTFWDGFLLGGQRPLSSVGPSVSGCECLRSVRRYGF